MKLRDYQQEIVDKINTSTSIRNCVQLSTGGGKTVIFSHLANNFKGRVLILVNRTELVGQTSRNITRPISLITAKTKKVGQGEVLIGMVESVHNRIKKGLFDINSVDLIIVDEIQNLQFIKVFESYEKTLLGFTATPVIMKKENYFKCKYCESKYENQIDCCGKETQKYNLKVSLKRWYGDLIQGIEIESLIERGNLTPVHNFVCNNPNLNKLKTDASGEYTNKSIDETFNNLASTENLAENYKQHCVGKKTMVFNANIEANNEAYKLFKMQGYNVRSYDSKSSEKRAEVVDWFRETPDGILMSVGVFTTGFDVSDVECIIMNKATQSLSLYHQIVGRGGRITDKIYKPFFKMIDLGGNVERFGSWSDSVDWNTIYNFEIEKKTQIRDVEDFVICHGCEAMISEYDCEYCGAKKPQKKAKSKVVIARELKKLPPPKAEHIIKYCIANELDVNDAKNLTANYILDMFIFAQTKRDTIEKNRDYLKSEIKAVVRDIYFSIHGSKLEGNRRRTLNNFEQKVFNKINKHYENRS
jgi:superfamily II DNA or RNA helicase